MYIIILYIIFLIILSQRTIMIMRLEKRKRKDRKTERPKDQKTIGALYRYTIIP